MSRQAHTRPVGRCYSCQGPVYPHQVERVTDLAVSAEMKRPVLRLAHRGECAAIVRSRVAFDATEIGPEGVRKEGPMAPLDMQAALNSEAEGWNPEPGAQVIGTVLYVSSASSEFGEYPIMELQSEEDGKAVTIHCFHQVLRNAVERWKPEPGDTVGVKYVGFVKAEGGPGDGYENYRMVVDRAAVTA